MGYVSKEEVIAKIRSHKQRVGAYNDIYQLAHDHIIALVSAMPDTSDPLVRTMIIADNERFLKDSSLMREEAEKELKQRFRNGVTIKADQHNII